MNQFYDKENGGFFFTSHDHEALIQRRKDYMDDATPSGNGIAVQVLLRLGHLLGDQNHLDAAEKTLKQAWSQMQSLPMSHASMLSALVEFSHPPRQIIIRGKQDEISRWQKQCRDAIKDTRTWVYAIPENIENLPGLLEKRQAQGNTVAYLCEGFTCKTPFTKLEQLTSDLKHCEIK